jgi:hypothetical protein
LRNEGGFFSDYYLGELLRTRHKGKLGENEVNAAFRRLSSRSERAFRSFGASTTGGRTRQLWLGPLFEELHFSLVPCPDVYDDRAGEEKISSSHAYQPEKGRPVLVYVDLLGWSDDLDSPMSGHKRRDTPHRRMERLLDRGEARWGIISNGKVIRLLRREQVSGGRRFFDADLETIFEEQDRGAFEVFWALFRADVFVPDASGKCLLDLVMEGCQQFAVRVSEELRNSVRIALESFVRGMLRNECNRELLKDVDPRVLFEQGLFFMYRLLFVLYGESRGLLPVEDRVYRESYSLETLRDLIDDQKQQFRPNEYRLWKSLQALFRMIRNGIETEELVVPPYNGGLFSEKTGVLLEKCRVSDDCMAEVLQTLSRTQPQKRLGRERIAYGELGIEELGAIYEGLLQYEPFIAKEEMAVVESKGEQIILPSRLTSGQEIVERIPVGNFYLSTWGGSRKQSGTYNTPLKITKWLVRQALESLVKGKSSDEILELNVLDPAMGSGAFLVSACQFLADEYAAALVAEGKEIRERIDEEVRAEYRRLVAERCIYGVDLNPLAIELAKVSLWLTTIAKGKPLTFLDQNLVCGDSLIGARLEDLGHYPWAAVGKAPKEQGREKVASSQLSLYEVGAFGSSLVSLVKSFETLETIRDETLEMIQRKAYLFEQDRKEGSFYAKCKQACDLWCSLWFWPEGKEFPDDREYQELVQRIFNGSCSLPDNKVKAYLDIIREIAVEKHFFHWELEFPAIFFDLQGRKEDAGFDAAVGNPPWETILTNSKEFFSAFDPSFRTLSKTKAKERAKELRKENNDIEERWNHYKKAIDKKNDFFRKSNQYPNHGEGHLNSFRLFLEKSFNLAKRDGLVAIIVPSSINSDKGARDLRQLLFSQSYVIAWVHFENRKKIFPIHSSFEFVLLTTQKRKATSELPCVFFQHELTVLEKFEKTSLRIPIALIKKFSPKSLSVTKFKNQTDVSLLSKIYNDHPLLGEYKPSTWNISFNAEEFNKTHDDAMFNREKKGWPVFEGGVFHQFQHDFSPPEIWMKEDKGLEELSKRYMKRLEGKRDPNLLAPLNYRLAFRLVASNTNMRTMISAILPPKVFLTNSAPYAYLRKTGKGLEFLHPIPPRLLCYVCGLLNSFVIDYVIRQKMAENLNLFYVKQIPLPRLSEDEKIYEEIVKRVAILTCSCEEYEELARACNVTVRKLANHERSNLIAEVNALVAHLFRLNGEDLQYILSTFPLIEDREKQLTQTKFKGITSEDLSTSPIEKDYGKEST